MIKIPLNLFKNTTCQLNVPLPPNSLSVSTPSFREPAHLPNHCSLKQRKDNPSLNKIIERVKKPQSLCSYYEVWFYISAGAL